MSGPPKLPGDQLSALRFEDVQLYLSSRGWHKEEAPATAKAVTYTYPNQRDAEILLPKQRALADYANRMADVVSMVATVEQRTVWEVLADLSVPPADVLRLRVSAPDATLGALPLDEAIRLIEGGRALLVAAACSAHQPQAYFPRLAFREALNFLKTCQFGQTERGSFVAKIMAPIPPQIERQQSLTSGDESIMGNGQLIANEPFARRATLTLMFALGHISSAIENGDYESILQGTDRGVSANLCEAVSSMQPEGDQSRLQIQMSWSRNRPRLPAGTITSALLSQTAFNIVREAGRKLREEPAARRTRIEGRIVTLKAEPSLLDDFEGTITLRTEVAGAPARVQALLHASQYKQACDAHRDGWPVAVTGILQREPKLYRLLQPQDFEVLSNS